ncbi:MAG TPA: shikimate dehydrogenase [Vicinamibacteria bacterium]
MPTQICVSLTETDTTSLIDRMVDLTDVADLFEVRGDLARDLDLLTLIRARTRPMLYACHPVSEGGRWDDADTKGRRLLLQEAVKRGFDYVDVEYRSGLLNVAADKAGRGLIVSHHDLAGTPEDLDSLYAGMAEMGADVVKIAVTPRSIADVGRLVAFAQDRARASGPPLLPIALGPMGFLTRILGGRWGAPFTYASAGPGREAGPGQIPAAQLADLYRVRSITPATRVYGVVGSDVARSLSPALHNRAFAARDLDAVYVPLQAEALAPFLEILPTLGLSGFSVTRPFKTDMVGHLQAVDEMAGLSGSVNTVVVQGGTLVGSSTDGHGVVAPLKKKMDLKGRRVVIVGAGGAARAAAFALRHVGGRVTVLARRPQQAAEVAAAVGCEHGDLADVASRPWDVLVNATPVGSTSDPVKSPVPARLHRPGTVVLDMVYDPLVTPLLKEAEAGGAQTVDGLQMLIAQAAGQFETWTGMEAPLDAMRAAALVAAQERLG